MSMSRLRSLFTGVVSVILVVPIVGLLGTPVAAGAQEAARGATEQVTFSRDVVADVRERAPVGPCHEAASSGARDAALVYR